jgi:hypothetical protein
LRNSGLGVLRPSVGDNLLELRVGEEHVIDIAALDRLVWSESYRQGANQSVGRVAEVSHQGAQLLLGRAQLCETEAVDLGNDGGDLGTGEKVTGATQDTRLVALGINLDELGETGLRAAKNIVKTDEKYRFFGDLLAAALVKRVSTRIPEGVPTVVVEVREKINDRGAVANGPGEWEDVMEIVQRNVSEQVCVVGTFWLKDVDATGRANETCGKHRVQADVTTNIDECVTRLQEQVHRQARFGLVELPGTEAVKHKPLTEELGVELHNDLSFQTGAVDGKARCDRGHGNSS